MFIENAFDVLVELGEADPVSVGQMKSPGEIVEAIKILSCEFSSQKKRNKKVEMMYALSAISVLRWSLGDISTEAAMSFTVMIEKSRKSSDDPANHKQVEVLSELLKLVREAKALMATALDTSIQGAEGDE